MQFFKSTLSAILLCYFFKLFIHLSTGRLVNESRIRNNIFFVESLRISQHSCFISNYSTPYFHYRYHTGLYAVPKKKPSRRRTRIRKTAWMKRFPKNYKRPMMLDMFDIVKYTDGTYTKSRTIHQSWLNLPNTKLDGKHVFTKEVRPSW